MIVCHFGKRTHFIIPIGWFAIKICYRIFIILKSNWIFKFESILKRHDFALEKKEVWNFNFATNFFTFFDLKFDIFLIFTFKHSLARTITTMMKIKWSDKCKFAAALCIFLSFSVYFWSQSSHNNLTANKKKDISKFARQIKHSMTTEEEEGKKVSNIRITHAWIQLDSHSVDANCELNWKIQASSNFFPRIFFAFRKRKIKRDFIRTHVICRDEIIYQTQIHTQINKLKFQKVKEMRSTWIFIFPFVTRDLNETNVECVRHRHIVPLRIFCILFFFFFKSEFYFKLTDS